MARICPWRHGRCFRNWRDRRRGYRVKPRAGPHSVHRSADDRFGANVSPPGRLMSRRRPGSREIESFTILGAPTLTSITPTGSSVGQTVSLTANGRTSGQARTAINASGTGSDRHVGGLLQQHHRADLLSCRCTRRRAGRSRDGDGVHAGGTTAPPLNFSVTSPAGAPDLQLCRSVRHHRGGTATAQPLQPPNDVAIDSNGNYYLVVQTANKVFKITPGGVLTTFAGTGMAGGGDGRARRTPRS